MKVVVDTNVIVSSFLSSQGSPSEVVRNIMSGRLRICYDMRILCEYAGVLNRPKFRISHAASAQFLDQVRAAGELTSATPLSVKLPDPNDIAFLEAALTANAECLITGDLRHFPDSCRHGMRTLTPAEFLQYYRDRQDRPGGAVKSPADEYRVTHRAGTKKSHAPSSRNARPVSFSKCTRRIDGTGEPGNVNWTPEEVAKVLRSIRRKKGAPVRSSGQETGKKPFGILTL